jgi:hypothetical protein
MTSEMCNQCKCILMTDGNELYCTVELTAYVSEDEYHVIHMMYKLGVSVSMFLRGRPDLSRSSGYAHDCGGKWRERKNHYNLLPSPQQLEPYSSRGS